MEKFNFEGECFYYKNGKWLSSSFTSVPLEMVSKLNKAYLDSNDLDNKNIDELTKIIDGARESGNYQLAAQALEIAMRKADIIDKRYLLPRLTSNYRELGRARRAISIGEAYINSYASGVWTPMLFTSLAAAYCDEGQYDTALKYAKRATALLCGAEDYDLMRVYQRIYKESA